MKSKINTKSIQFKIWRDLILLSLAILALIWILQVYLLDAFYESMKLRDANRIADKLISEYDDAETLDDFSQRMNRTIRGTDIYVRVEKVDGSVLLVPDEENDHLHFFEGSTDNLRKMLFENDLPSYSEINEGPGHQEILCYACYLDKPESETPEDISNTTILYMFSPLHPVRSTVSILRYQLFYITIIVFLLAISFGLYLATKISQPIKDITEGASKLGKGDYTIQFQGSTYSEVDELAEALTKASSELAKADSYQKDLIANVSHDLKTPITMIKSYAEMIKDLSGDDPQKREAHLNVILDEADTLNVLVTDIVNISKIQNGAVSLNIESFDLSQTISTILTSFDILSEQEGYIFTLNAPEEMLVMGDRVRIHQVVANLITNAVKYCGDDKEIIITLKSFGKIARCEITDHGPGIPEDELPHVWERYFKSSVNHERPIEGSGLGLSICKEILNLHKAHYGVNSALGEGSTFWFELEKA